ncbi:MAG: hypothetical protein AAF400_02075 [Bacteroidota bacterium]
MQKRLLAFITGLVLGMLGSDKDKEKLQKVLRKQVRQLQKNTRPQG